MSSTYRPIAPILTQRDLYPQPVTALSFDPVSDTLWTGNNTGSIAAYYGTQGARGVSLMFSSGDGGVGDGDSNPVTQQCFTNDGRNKTKFMPGFPASSV